MNAETLFDLVGNDVISMVNRPIEEARGLPALAYTSQAFFEQEIARVFRRTWMGVAFASDVAGPGDAIPVTMAGVPMIVCRDEQGEVRVFHNVCRHRASVILTEPAERLSLFTCPYHAWTYGLDGALKRTPFYDGTRAPISKCLEQKDNGLVPIRCGEWGHWIFVNIDGNAPPLDEYLGEVLDYSAGFDIGATVIGHREDWEVDANWKLQNDNWETYHHVALHKEIFTRISDDLEMETGKPWSETLQLENAVMLRRRERAGEYPHSANGLPLIPLKEATVAPRRSTTLIFPNTTLTFTPDHMASVITDPLSPARTGMKMAYYFVGDAATSEACREGRESVLERWLGKSRSPRGRDGIRSQDMGMWEGQQCARKSPVSDDVKFSPTWEANVHHFQKWLLAHMGED